MDGVVSDPRAWAYAAGWKYQCFFGENDQMTAHGAANDGLDGQGWTRGTQSNGTLNATGDFLSAADDSPVGMLFSITNQNLMSPRIFGSYDHMLQASRFLGYFPTKLCCEVRALFIASGSNSAFFGLGTSALNIANGAGSAAGIYRQTLTPGKFAMQSDNSVADVVGPLGDALPHLFKIVVDATNTNFYVDDIGYGSISTETDIWPIGFHAWQNASASANFQISTVEMWYE